MTQGSPSLWSRRSAALVAAAIGVGFLLIVFAFAGALDRHTLASQVGSLNLAVLGITISGAAELLWLVAGRQRISRVRERLTDAVVTADAARQPVLVAGSSSASLVVVEGSTWLHHRACRLVTGKRVKAYDDDLAGRSRCPVCEGRP